MINEDYVSFEIAQTLKEAGFDWPTHGYYHKGNCAEDEVWYYTMNPADDHNHSNNPRVWSAPTLAQAQKWLREKKKWHIIIEPRIWEQQVYDFKLWHFYRGYENNNRGLDYLSYEAALSAGIEAALKLIEEGIV